MPNLAERIQKNGTSQFMSWRWAFFLPGCMHIGSALAILAFGQVSTAGAACLKLMWLSQVLHERFS